MAASNEKTSSSDVPWPLLKRSDIDQSPSRTFDASIHPVSPPPPQHLPPAPITAEQQSALILYYTDIIYKCGLRLQLPIRATNTAIHFFQRYYTVVPLQAADALLTVDAALFLAAKVDECARRIRDVINVVHIVSTGDPSQPLTVSQSYWDRKELVIRRESSLLRALAFKCDVKHPHIFVLHFGRALECSAELTRIAYYIANDSMRLPLCIMYEPSLIAVACLHLAAELMGESMQMNLSRRVVLRGGREWFEWFGVNRLELEDAIHQIIDLYERIDNIDTTNNTDNGPFKLMRRNTTTNGRSPHISTASLTPHR